MKKIVNCYLNVRIGSPSVAASCIEYLAPGMTVEVKDSVAGSMIDGNNTWYRDEADNYYWSGGFQNDLFVDRLIGQLKKATISEFLTAESAALLQGITGIEGIGWSMENKVFFICIFYSGQAPQDLPATLLVKNDFDSVVSVPVKIKATTSFEVHTNLLPSDFIKNKIPLVNAQNQENIGSLGYFVNVPSESKIMGITCYHVVRDNFNDFDLDDQAFPNRSFDITLLNNQSNIATIFKGGIDDKLDVALIEFFNQVTTDPRIPIIGKTSTPRDITEVDVNNKIAVRMFGAKSRFKQGVITDIVKEAIINYGFVNKTLHDLIVVESANGPFSQPGDSGSLVVDAANAAIGIIVAGDNTRSLVIPINRILKKFEAQLPK